MKQNSLQFVVLALVILLFFSGCGANGPETNSSGSGADSNIFSAKQKETYTLETIPEFSGVPYIALHQNQPDFTKEEKEHVTSFESYSELDALGRCQTACANLSRETMPEKERGAIGHIRPSGWHTVKYNDLIDGLYLYNRCHLIGYQLSGENANEKNLITGTRYLNVEGMLPFENEVADYIRRTENHVLYRVTPVFKGENLLAQGVVMEAYSVEDNGEGICFHVYVYNCQPGIFIDYATGDSRIMTEEEKAASSGGSAVCSGKQKKQEEQEKQEEQ